MIFFYPAGVAQGQIMGIELKRVFEGLESGTSCRLTDYEMSKGFNIASF